MNKLMVKSPGMVLEHKKLLGPDELRELCYAMSRGRAAAEELAKAASEDSARRAAELAETVDSPETKRTKLNARRWQERIAEIRSFVDSHGHLPSAKSSNTDEKFLARSLSLQRGRYRAGTLPPGRIADCESLPGWTWGAQQPRDKILSAAVAEGREAKAKIVESNLGLVYTIASRHFSVLSKKADRDDVIQDGILGLCRAAELFDPDRGYKFSTYAWYWIRKTIEEGSRAASDNPVFSNPTARSKRFRLDAVTEFLSTDLGYSPTDAELAVELGQKEEDVRLLRDVSITHFEDSPFDEGDGNPNLSSSDEGEQAAIEASLLTTELMGVLGEKERRVIELLYGFDGAGERSHVEVAKILGVSTSTVKTRLDRAMRLLREAARIHA
jgi:RNA polymerase sigma factor (sigma-70 family)